MALLNINVGILGHVDSGKTSLAKALSQVASTASFDKHPQSQERGITIDLGFSSFKTPAPSHLKEYDTLLFTLVDCPGHASLISTVIGGAQIIDLMILVVDATKGVQAQTAECIVIAEITKKKLIVVLNKTDLLNSEEQKEKLMKKMRVTLDKLVFKGCPIVCTSAISGDTEKLIECLKEQAFVPERDGTAPFLMAVDHCFGILGKGTVFTGTVLQGTVKVGDDVEIAAIKTVKKVKSIQMFRQAVEKASQGDRVGVCVTQFDPKTLERGLASKPNLLSPTYAAILDFEKVRYHNIPITSRSRYHIAIGHETVLATALFFEATTDDTSFDLMKQYKYLSTIEVSETSRSIFALLEFDHPVVTAPNAWAIGARLDMAESSTCRMAFYGKLQHSFHNKSYKDDNLSQLQIYKEKFREGVVERVNDSYTLIGKEMFKKTTDISKFTGMGVILCTGESGLIEGSFGQSGKFRVRLKDELKERTKELLQSSKTNHGDGTKENVRIILHHKRFIFDLQKKMIQN